MRLILTAAVAATLTACQSAPPTPGSRVQVHAQVSAALDGCKKLAPVRATITKKPFVDSWELALAELREETARAGGDSLVLLQLDDEMTQATRQGIAYRCF